MPLINNNLSNTFYTLISKYKNISIFFHKKPDGDCLGAAFGMYQYLIDNYKGKDIRISSTNLIIDDNFTKLFAYSGKECNSDFIKDSLAIIVDVNSNDRICDSNYILAKDIIVIDHHPIIKKNILTKNEILSSEVSSACELTYSLLSLKNKISCNTAQYLYIGLVTDTGRFMYAIYNNTFDIACKLANIIDISKIPSIYKTLYTKSLKEKKVEIFLQHKIVYKDNYAYLVIPKKTFSKFDITPNSFVYLLGDVSSINIWTTIYYDEELKQWKGSIRSRGNFDVSMIAKKYNGGGHKNASGYCLSKKSDIKNVIIDIKDILK